MKHRDPERQRRLEAILEVLPVRQILDHYNIEIKDDTRKSRRGGIELDGVCPFHVSSTLNFSMNSSTGLWICRSSYCGKSGDLLRFVALSESCSESQALDRLYGLAGIEREDLDDLVLALQSFTPQEETKATESIYVPLVLPDTYRFFPHPYLVHERLIDPDVLVQARAGGIKHDDFYRYRACIPIYMGGECYALYSRRVSEDVDAWKHKNPDLAHKAELYFRKHDYYGQTPIGHLVYGLDEARDSSDTVILVEAIISVLRLRTLGIYNAAAIFKAHISTPQIQHLIERKFSRVILCMDNDLKEDAGNPGNYINPGAKAAWKNYHKLKRYFEVGIMTLPINRDPADTVVPFTGAEFLTLKSETYWPQRTVQDKEALRKLARS